MNSERWRKIDRIYNDALGIDEPLRAGFVAQACSGDEELRLEIESLLAVDASAPDAVLNQALMNLEVNIVPGTRFGPYEIEEPLGEGGMGKVFRALDTRLGRKVALKILNARFADRGGREARAIASLNHPHVCTIFEAGENYLAMELVEGETLAARLRTGPLHLQDGLRYGAQIADALAAAHSKGLIHRDLKPANIMLTKTGVKVLDFGLAKFIDLAGETLTQSGVVMGTPGYMAPEQREGRVCDQRTDIYALGLILAEMITGKRASLEEAKLSPPGFAHIVKRCLERDPDDRWQSARDIKAELEWLLAAPAPAEAPKPSSRRRNLILSIGAAAMALLALLLGLRQWFTNPKPPRITRVAIAINGNGISSDPGNLAGPAAISPDGETVVLQTGAGARRNLWIRRFESSQFEQLSGTEGAKTPFWSPDGTRVAFFTEGKLKKISIRGGPAETICAVETAASRGGAWSSNGTILIGMNFRGILSVSDQGGEPRQIIPLDPKLGENSLRFPQFLPDGKRFIYYARTDNPANHGIYLDSLDAAGKGPRRKLAIADGPAQVGHDPFTNADFLVYPNDKNVWTQSFDLDREQLGAEKIAISDDVGPFSLSRTGTLVFRLASANATALTWLGRDGRAISNVGQPGDYWDLRLSPDQHRLAVLNHRSSDGAFWIEIVDLIRNLTTAMSDAHNRSFGLVWGRDSARLYYASWGAEVKQDEMAHKVIEKAIDQAGEGKVLSVSSERFVPMDLSPDNTQLAGEHEFGGTTIQKGSALALTPLQTFQWRESAHSQLGNVLPQFSPDGHWIAYQSNTSGRFEVYLTDFPEGRRNRQISVAGGAQPRWSADGRELFYMGPDSSIWSAGTLAALSAGSETPVKLFGFPIPVASSYFQYDVARDGQRFLVVNGQPDAGSQEIRVIFNWPQLVREAKRNSSADVR